ncbi:hypothetical protein [Clostridium sp. D33t1_170424_F3]|uniref:hypothetical protein n=1 Tax=Clostridium sp. D33t1_170424_F3 TaxID=2787099 RepID=UPI0018AC3732|nr:hypothetical protein [Clostridium sp. D33t1_170424_F3]
MKKFICICLVTLLSCIVLNGCAQKTPVKIVQPNNDVIDLHTPSNLDEFEAEVDCIVKGILSDDSEEVLRESSIDLGNGKTAKVVTGGWTITSLQITEVFKGDLKAGNTIRLDEPYWIENRDEGPVVFIDEFYPNPYVPAEKGKEYLFFLMHQDESRGEFADTYAVNSRIYNHLPVISSNTRSTGENLLTQNLSETEKDVLGSDETYLDFYRQAIDKYMK